MTGQPHLPGGPEDFVSEKDTGSGRKRSFLARYRIEDKGGGQEYLQTLRSAGGGGRTKVNRSPYCASLNPGDIC